jgi:hypothetical protein
MSRLVLFAALSPRAFDLCGQSSAPVAVEGPDGEVHTLSGAQLGPLRRITGSATARNTQCSFEGCDPRVGRDASSSKETADTVPETARAAVLVRTVIQRLPE